MVSFECNPMYVKDVEDRSNTPKAVMLCMSKMSKMSKIDHTHKSYVCRSMLKMSKIDQIHLRAVMLCMSKMGKEHTHTFWLITSLILNDFQSEKSFGKLIELSNHTIKSYVYLSMLKMFIIQTHFYHTFLNMISFECNPMYVEDVKLDQIHLRAVMLCMSKMSKMGKEHTHTSSTSSTCFD